MAIHEDIDHTGIAGCGAPSEITDIATTEMDDSLVLAPDGAGGVEFRAEAGGASYVGVKAYNSGVQTIPTATDTELTFDSEDWDTSSFHSTVAATGDFTIPTTGRYAIHAKTTWPASGTGGRKLHILVNDSIVYTDKLAAVNTQQTEEANTVLSLTAADVVSFEVYQSTGGNFDAGDASDRAYKTEASLTYLG